MLCNRIASVAAAALFVAAAATAAPSNKTVVVAFGDSTTAPRGELTVYATLLEMGLPAKGISAKVINAGVPGDTTSDARRRFEKDVLAHKPNLVIIQLGLNDSAVDVWKNPPATEPRVCHADYEANLRYFVRTIKGQGARVILMTPNASRWSPQFLKAYGKPPYRPNDPNGFNVMVKDYVEIVRRLARTENVTLVDVYEAFQAYDKRPGRKTDDLLLDGEHPDAEGHQLIADMLLKCDVVSAMASAVGTKEFERFVVASHEKTLLNAYPCMSRLVDGRLLLVWDAAPTRQCLGPIAGALSTDHGRTWAPPTVLIPESLGPFGDPSIVVSDKRIIVTGTAPHGPGVAATTITAVRSDDNGKTWSRPYDIPMNHRYVCGKIHPGLRLKSGRLLMGYSWDIILESQGKSVDLEKDMHTRSGVMISTDDGLTWHNGGDFDATYERVSTNVGPGVAEPAMVELDDGSIFMLVRNGSDHLYQARSLDEGKTWTEIRPSSLRGCDAPAALCKFRAGQRSGILCVWDNAFPERFPLCAAASFDGGKTWSKPKDIAGPTDGKEVSYPGCEQAADGMLVAVWQQEVEGGRDIRCARFSVDWLLRD